MSVDYFPTTQRTWLATQIADGARGLDAARVHVMERSHAALVAYVRGARVAALGEPDDIVHDFFARNLGKSDYLARWLASGLSLRRWLMNGVSAHIRAHPRALARARDARAQARAARRKRARARVRHAWRRARLRTRVDPRDPRRGLPPRRG